MKASEYIFKRVKLEAKIREQPFRIRNFVATWGNEGKESSWIRLEDGENFLKVIRKKGGFFYSTSTYQSLSDIIELL